MILPSTRSSLPLKTILAGTCLLLAMTQSARAQHKPEFAGSLLFHASFDAGPDAEVAKGDGRIYTAQTLKRSEVQAGLHSDAVTWNPEQGRYGGGLTFTRKVDPVVFFQGAGNVPRTDGEFDGTVSFWMRLSPEQDLPPGYVDPLQITDKGWNNSSFFVDFTKELPRKFRLGVFSDFAFWNPENRKWDDIPENERPFVTVDKPPFSKDRWTHVAFTFDGFNRETPGEATFYLDGKKQGTLRQKQRYSWGEDRLAILLGIYYVGDFDDLAIFDAPLTDQQIQQLYALPNGVSSLHGK